MITLQEDEPSAIESAPSEQEPEEEESDQTITDVSEGPELAIPGYSAPERRPYLGPEFPPKAPALVEPPRDSDDIAAQIRERDAVQGKAMEW